MKAFVRSYYMWLLIVVLVAAICGCVLNPRVMECNKGGSPSATVRTWTDV